MAIDVNYSHVLITRPEPESAELERLLEDTGLQVIRLPACRFEPEYPGLDFNTAWQPGMRRLAVFCSTRAVEFGLRQLPAGFLDDVEIAAIGPATARSLEAAGHPVSILPEAGYDSESLLAHPELADEPGTALLFSAPGGRQKLYSALQERGWQVRFAHVYRAVELDPPKQATREILASTRLISTWTSGNALQHLAQALEAAAWERVCAGAFVVISDRLAQQAAGFASGRVLVSEGPGNPQIAAAVRVLVG
jgi:uroporphyrinogen-III synthase